MKFGDRHETFYQWVRRHSHRTSSRVGRRLRGRWYSAQHVQEFALRSGLPAFDRGEVTRA